MKQKYTDVRFGAPALQMLTRIMGVVESYQRQGYRLTLRQLYYQLVARDIIPNRLQSYQKICDLLTRGRLGGYIDWNAIEDRGRAPKMASEFDDLSDLVESAKASFRLPRWNNQEEYVELWTEKDALTSILWPIAHKYHIRLIVNKGYSSTSAMYAAHRRFDDHEDKECTMLYLGDHDPSGLDMDRDIGARLETFGVDWVDVQRIALTKEQINEFAPPPNPAKIADPRATGYIAEHGAISWEVDALQPQDLVALIEGEIESHLDLDKFNAVIEKEERLKRWLTTQLKDSPEFHESVEEDEEAEEE